MRPTGRNQLLLLLLLLLRQVSRSVVRVDWLPLNSSPSFTCATYERPRHLNHQTRDIFSPSSSKLHCSSSSSCSFQLLFHFLLFLLFLFIFHLLLLLILFLLN